MRKRSDTRRIFRLTVAAIILFAIGVAAQTVKVTANPAFNISALSKYAWQKNTIVVRQSPDVNARMEKILLAAIENELAKKGYTLDPRSPDFFISVEAFPFDDVSVSSGRYLNVPDNIKVYTTQRPDGPGAVVIPMVITRIQIVATDPASQTVVWQSLTEKKVKDIDKAVRQMEKGTPKIIGKALKAFPIRQKRL